jgi:hypothetical protein
MMKGNLKSFNKIFFFENCRTNYVRFLKHHAPMIQLIDEIDQPNRKSLSVIDENSSRMSSDRNTGNELSNKLRRKV